MSFPDFNKSTLWSTANRPTYDFGAAFIVKLTVSFGSVLFGLTLIETYIIISYVKIFQLVPEHFLTLFLNNPATFKSIELTMISLFSGRTAYTIRRDVGDISLVVGMLISASLFDILMFLM